MDAPRTQDEEHTPTTTTTTATTNATAQPTVDAVTADDISRFIYRTTCYGMLAHSNATTKDGQIHGVCYGLRVTRVFDIIAAPAAPAPGSAAVLPSVESGESTPLPSPFSLRRDGDTVGLRIMRFPKTFASAPAHTNVKGPQLRTDYPTQSANVSKADAPQANAQAPSTNNVVADRPLFSPTHFVNGVLDVHLEVVRGMGELAAVTLNVLKDIFSPPTRGNP